jgi:Icc-related predicted phosphoesterase
VTAAINLAAIGDLHVTKKSVGVWQPIFAQANARADVLLLAGDLTDYGLPEEAHVLCGELSRTVKIPIIAVLGNHDYESGKEADVRAILGEAGVVVLDGDAHEIGDVGFVGVKGFCGGFGRRTLEPWGEPMIKNFVHEAVGEAMKLESGLARLRTQHRVALLHYAPVQATVEGEPPEIFPFLGSTRLEDPLNRYDVTAVFHGHAHRGSPEGRTREGIPVYNVAAPLLRRLSPDAPPFVVVPVGAERKA